MLKRKPRWKDRPPAPAAPAEAREVAGLRAELAQAQARAERLDGELQAARVEAARLRQDLAAARQHAVDLAASHVANERVEEACADIEEAAAQKVAALLSVAVLEALRAVGVTAERALRPVAGVLAVKVRFEVRVLAPREIPELGTGSRQDTIAGIELHRRLGRIPLVIHLSSEHYNAVALYGWEHATPAPSGASGPAPPVAEGGA